MTDAKKIETMQNEINNAKAKNAELESELREARATAKKTARADFEKIKELKDVIENHIHRLAESHRDTEKSLETDLAKMTESAETYREEAAATMQKAKSLKAELSIILAERDDARERYADACDDRKTMSATINRLYAEREAERERRQSAETALEGAAREIREMSEANRETRRELRRAQEAAEKARRNCNQNAAAALELVKELDNRAEIIYAAGKMIDAQTRKIEKLTAERESTRRAAAPDICPELDEMLRQEELTAEREAAPEPAPAPTTAKPKKIFVASAIDENSYQIIDTVRNIEIATVNSYDGETMSAEARAEIVTAGLNTAAKIVLLTL